MNKALQVLPVDDRDELIMEGNEIGEEPQESDEGEVAQIP